MNITISFFIQVVVWLFLLIKYIAQNGQIEASAQNWKDDP